MFFALVCTGCQLPNFPTFVLSQRHWPPTMVPPNSTVASTSSFRVWPQSYRVRRLHRQQEMSVERRPPRPGLNTDCYGHEFSGKCGKCMSLL